MKRKKLYHFLFCLHFQWMSTPKGKNLLLKKLTLTFKEQTSLWINYVIKGNN